MGPWPSGPIWFVWVLLAFDLTASLLYRVSAHLVDPINRLSQRGFDRPAVFFLFLLAVSAVVYVPSLLYFGPNHWFEFGPFSVQASRLLLYAAYFFIGAGIGAANFERGILSAEWAAAKSSWGWIAATRSVLPDVVMIYIKREILGNPTCCRTGITPSTARSSLLSAPRYYSRSWPTSCASEDRAEPARPMQGDAYGKAQIFR